MMVFGTEVRIMGQIGSMTPVEMADDNVWILEIADDKF